MAGPGHRLDLVFDTTLPSGQRMRYQVLRIAVPRKGRALPLLQLAYDRDHLSPDKSQNQIEQDALLAVLGALPKSVRPVILADRGFHRASFIAWLEGHHLNYVVRIRKGACITEASGRRFKLGQEGLKIGELRLMEGVRYGLYHGRPRDLLTNVALCWRISKGRAKNPRRKQPEDMVPGHEPQGRQDGRLLVLAAGMDRAIFQRLEEPLWLSAGAGWFSQAPFAPAYGAHDRAFVADFDGASRRGWRRAQGFARGGGRRLGEGKRDHSGACAVRERWEPAASLSTPTNGRWVGGYASVLTYY
jgi:hypothetical protein